MWLANGDLKRETESLIIAAQDQALMNTNSIKKSIYKLDVSDKCRLCGKETENVTHIVSSCGMLAQKEYKRRHTIRYARISTGRCASNSDLSVVRIGGNTNQN